MTKRLTIIGGAYGSGKTEFAIAYALHLAATQTLPVGLVDLDIVNPYFRSRDVAKQMEREGLTVISTEPGLEYSDMPALSPRIYSLLQGKENLTVFDVGGDPAGARALGRFNPYFTAEAYDFLVVVNPYRPDTRNVAEAERLIAGLEVAGRVQVSGLVANINLGRETTLEVWREGLPLVNELAANLGLPIGYHMVEENFLQANREFFKEYPVFPVKLKMLPPWLQP